MTDPDSVLARLRAATRAAHDRVERTPPMARLMAADVTAADVRAALVRLHGFFAPIEAALHAPAWPAEAAFLGRAPRHPRMARDLAALGTAPGPPMVDLPPMAGLDRRLGVAYVLEGSALGAMVIGRHLAGRPEIPPLETFAETAAPWQRLVPLLETLTTDPDMAAEGARRTFEVLEAWLARPDLKDR